MLRLLILASLVTGSLFASVAPEVAFVKKVVETFQVDIDKKDPTGAAIHTIEQYFDEIGIARQVCAKYALKMREEHRSTKEIASWIKKFSKIYTRHMAVVYTTKENLRLFQQYKWVDGSLQSEGDKKWVLSTFEDSEGNRKYIRATLKPSDSKSWLVTDIAFGNDPSNLINITSADRGSFDAKLSEGEDPLSIFAHSRKRSRESIEESSEDFAPDKKRSGESIEESSENHKASPARKKQRI